MKLSQFPAALVKVQALGEIDDMIADVEHRLGVTLHGRYHDELVPVARPALVYYLGEQRKRIVDELSDLGIDIDEE
jgi:hypothetical protein